MTTANQTWPHSALRGITSKIGSGATPRGGRKSYKTEGISLIRSLNVYDLGFEDKALAFIDEVQAGELENVTVLAKDILLNITGASVARCCMVPIRILPARVNQHVAIIRVIPQKANPRYVLHCLCSHRYKNHLLTLAQGGATREALTKTTIQNFEIPNPPLTTQRNIAVILSAYDDLINNNRRRIQILVQMAQAVYREWFVRFRFPGHENVRMVDSPLGKIPEGWEIRAIGDLLEHNIGGDWGKEEPTEKERQEVRVVRGADIVKLKAGDFATAPHRFIKEASFNKRGLKEAM